MDDEITGAFVGEVTMEVARYRAMEAALIEIARLRTDLRGDFSMGSHQSDIARRALATTGGVTRMTHSQDGTTGCQLGPRRPKSNAQ